MFGREMYFARNTAIEVLYTAKPDDPIFATLSPLLSNLCYVFSPSLLRLCAIIATVSRIRQQNVSLMCFFCFSFFRSPAKLDGKRKTPHEKTPKFEPQNWTHLWDFFNVFSLVFMYLSWNAIVLILNFHAISCFSWRKHTYGQGTQSVTWLHP